MRRTHDDFFSPVETIPVSATAYPCGGAPLWLRKFGADRFLHVEVVPKDKREGNQKATSPKAHDLHHALADFEFLGRRYTRLKWKKKSNRGEFLLPPHAKKEKTDEEDGCSRVCLFFAIDTVQHLSDLSAYKAHNLTLDPLSVDDLYDWFLSPAGVSDLLEKEGGKKFWKRLDLALTDAIPCVVLEPDEIEEVDALRSESDADVELNDGQGTISRILACEIQDMMGLSYTPAMVQIRLGVVKGTLLVDQTLRGRKVKINSTMIKYKRDWRQIKDPILRTLAVKLVAHKEAGIGKLNPQVIAVLEGGGVGADMFVNLAETDIKRELSLDGLQALPPLEAAKKDGIRAAQDMLTASIKPSEEPFLCEAMSAYLNGKIERLRKDGHVSCPRTWTAFFACDVHRVLLPHEVISVLQRLKNLGHPQTFKIHPFLGSNHTPAKPARLNL